MANKKRNFLSSFTGSLLAAAGYFGILRPWIQNWGCKGFESKMALPGDDLIPFPDSISNRSISISAPAEKVWPWLIQMGYQRAGWYSYDQLENAIGVADFIDGHSSSRVIPELQDLQIGDAIPAAPEPYLHFKVIQLIKPECLVLEAFLQPFTGKVLNPTNSKSRIWMHHSWCFHLLEDHKQNTHLIVRSRIKYQPRLLLHPFTWFLLEPIYFLMEQKMLKGIKLRAEKY